MTADPAPHATPAAGASTVSGPRGLLLATAGCLAAAALLLLASGQTWLRLVLPARPPLPDVGQTLNGQEVVEVLVPVGILVGAASLALLASSRIGRRVVAVVLILAGLVAVTGIVFFLQDDGSLQALRWEQAHAAPGESLRAERDVSIAPAVFALLGGATVVAVGLYAALRSSRWPVMGARFERHTGRGGDVSKPTPAGRQPPADASQPASEAAMWDAIERGEDPTEPLADPGAHHPAQATRDDRVSDG